MSKVAQGPDFKELRIANALGIRADVIELKIDGTCQTWGDGELISERGINRNARFPHIVSALKQFDWKVQGETAIPGCGMNIHHVNKSENWHRANYFLFKINELKGHSFRDAPPEDVRRLIEETLQNKPPSCIQIPTRFSSIQEGWDYVIKNRMEGLVTKNAYGQDWKIKHYIEAKWKIVGFEQGSVKGSFILMNPSTGDTGGCSALSVDYVAKYKAIVAGGQVPYAEFEYLFLTDNNIPFQPRLRDVYTI